MIDILQQIGISFLGMFLYTLLAFRKYIKRKEASKLVFWQSVWIESRLQYLYAVLLIVVISVIIKVLPNAGQTIYSLTGFDVSNSLMSFLTLGFATLGSIDSEK